MSIIHKDGIYCPMILVETKCTQQRKILHILQNHSPHISGHLSVSRSESCASILSHASLLWLLMAESSHRPVQPYSLSCNVKDLHQYLTSLAMKLSHFTGHDYIHSYKVETKQDMESIHWKSLFLIPLTIIQHLFWKTRCKQRLNWTDFERLDTKVHVGEPLL